MEAIRRSLPTRYVDWLLGQRMRSWTIWFYAALGLVLLAFGVDLLGRNLDAGVTWSIVGAVAILVAHGLLVMREASTRIARLEAENARLRAQLGRS
jgi:hypothetical protein